MPSINEAAELGKTELASDLEAGVKAISYNASITFRRYVKLVLPLDGYVFWVRDTLVSQSALYNALQFNAAYYNQPPAQTNPEPAPVIEVMGSLHYMTDTRQDESETYAVNAVVFTCMQEVTDLNDAGPEILWIGEFQGLRFAFSSRGSFYRQANLYHYRGQAVFADMETQIVDKLEGFSQSLIVSNSLPIWLALNDHQPFYGIKNPGFRLYPSYLIPNNQQPYYGAVHIPPGQTEAIAMAPLLSRTMSHSQLVAERVKITLWGQRNASALDFVDFVQQYSLDYDTIGIMNSPVVQDEKRTQNELNTIAMKKTVEFEVNYYQSSARNIARQQISRAIPQLEIAD